MKKVYLIAAVTAILCGILVYNYCGNIESRIQAAAGTDTGEQIQMSEVIFALCDIPEFTEIDSSMIEIRNLPEECVTEDMASDESMVLGLVCDRDIKAGEIIMTGAVGTLEEMRPVLSTLIPEGYNAVTVSVDSYSGVGGYIAEGDRVNVMYFLEKTDTSPAEAALVIENAQVLKVGASDYSEEDGLYNSVTLALTSSQCTELYKKMKEGYLYFTLLPFTEGGS